MVTHVDGHPLRHVAFNFGKLELTSLGLEHALLVCIKRANSLEGLGNLSVARLTDAKPTGGVYLGSSFPRNCQLILDGAIR